MVQQSYMPREEHSITDTGNKVKMVDMSYMDAKVNHISSNSRNMMLTPDQSDISPPPAGPRVQFQSNETKMDDVKEMNIQ